MGGYRNQTQPLPRCLAVLSIDDVTGSSEFPVTFQVLGQDADVRSGSLDLWGQVKRFLELVVRRWVIKARMEVRGKKKKKMEKHIAVK